jgi:lipopolysaccharide exporter
MNGAEQQGPVKGGVSSPELPAHDPGRKRKPRRGSFGADVLKLATGTVLAQGITLLLSPLLTRLYAPQAFGVWALFSSITTIIGVVACLRYDIAIMLPESEEEGASLLGVSLLAVTAVSIVAFGAALVGRGAIVSALKAPEITPWLWLIPVAVFVNGVYLALSSWSSRSRRFARLSAARVGGSATSSAVQLGLGYAGSATALSLIASSLAGTGISTAVLGAQIGREDGAVLQRGLRWSRLRQGIRRYRKFPVYGSISVLLNTISWQLPAILLQRFFSAEVVGYYSLGNRLLRIPMDLVGGAISQAFYPRAAAARAAGQLAEVVEAAYRRLVTIGFAPMLVLGIVASDLFRIAFGARWAEAGVYTQILSVWTFFWFISSPLSTLFAVLEMQEFGLKLNIVILGTRFLSLAAGGLMGDARLALMLFAASGVFVYGYYSFAILAAAGVRWSAALRILASGVAAVSPIAAVLIAGKLAGVPAWLEVLAAGLSLAAFFSVVVRRDPALLAILKSVRSLRS